MAYRFNDYQGITAKYASKSTACGAKESGHPIAVGDLIGWARGGRRSKSATVCAGCWARWVAENQEADLYEANLPW